MRFNPISATRWLLRFLTHDIWHITNEDVRGAYLWLVNIIKAVYLSVRFFLADRIMEKASALTYYTLLAIVPMMALVLGIAKGFNIQEYIESAMISAFPGQTEVIGYLFNFGEAYLAHTQTGVVMGIGIVMLLYVIINMIGNVETVFNQIWQQKKGRSTVRKLTDYLSIMLLVPVLLMFSSGLQIYLQTFLRTNIIDAEISASLLRTLRLLPYLLVILLMTLVYIVIPNTKVKFINAFIAACIAGSAFIIFQQLYISGQIWVSKYNAIYGSFAALPLLLLWIQMSWIICLYGAELAYASQNIQNFNFEKDTQNISRQYYDFLTAIVAGHIFHSFALRQPAPTTEEVCHTLHLPSKLTGNIIARLGEQGIICETLSVNDADDDGNHTWIPGRDSATYSIADLTAELEDFGITDFKYEYTRIFEREWQALGQMRRASYESGKDILIRDIVPTENHEQHLS